MASIGFSNSGMLPRQKPMQPAMTPPVGAMKPPMQAGVEPPTPNGSTWNPAGLYKPPQGGAELPPMGGMQMPYKPPMGGAQLQPGPGMPSQGPDMQGLMRLFGRGNYGGQTQPIRPPGPMLR